MKVIKNTVTTNVMGKDKHVATNIETFVARAFVSEAVPQEGQVSKELQSYFFPQTYKTYKATQTFSKAARSCCTSHRKNWECVRTLREAYANGPKLAFLRMMVKFCPLINP